MRCGPVLCYGRDCDAVQRETKSGQILIWCGGGELCVGVRDSGVCAADGLLCVFGALLRDCLLGCVALLCVCALCVCVCVCLCIRMHVHIHGELCQKTKHCPLAAKIA